MNDITELRKHLFAALDGLANKDQPMDIERARAISDVAQTVINTAKVEIDHLRLTGDKRGTGFLPAPDVESASGNSLTATGEKNVKAISGGTVTTHRMRG